MSIQTTFTSSFPAPPLNKERDIEQPRPVARADADRLWIWVSIDAFDGIKIVNSSLVLKKSPMMHISTLISTYIRDHHTDFRAELGLPDEINCDPRNARLPKVGFCSEVFVGVSLRMLRAAAELIESWPVPGKYAKSFVMSLILHRAVQEYISDDFAREMG